MENGSKTEAELNCVSELKASPDGKMIAYLSFGPFVMFWDVLESREAQLFFWLEKY